MCSLSNNEAFSTCSRVRGQGTGSNVYGVPNTMSMVPPFAGKDPLVPPGSRLPNIVTGTTGAPETSAR